MTSNNKFQNRYIFRCIVLVVIYVEEHTKAKELSCSMSNDTVDAFIIIVYYSIMPKSSGLQIAFYVRKSLQMTCSTFIFVYFSRQLNISIIITYLPYSCAFTFEKFMLVKRLNILDNPINKNRLNLLLICALYFKSVIL